MKIESIEQAKAALLECKRALTLDMPDNQFPANSSHNMAHYWNACAYIELAINALTLSQREVA